MSSSQTSLSGKTALPRLTRAATGAECYPERIAQFGTGNFLKGFANWIVQELNDRTGLDAGIVAVKLRRGNECLLDEINAQDGLFTVNSRGIHQGEQVDDLTLIRCQNRALSPYRDFQAFLALAELPELAWIVSNATESGIVFDPADRATDLPPESFPAKLTVFLYHRFKCFGGDLNRGVHVFCCELIEDNAEVLRQRVVQYARHWKLPPAFLDWLNGACHFCNTLVDRIVTGTPGSASRRAEIEARLGYRDSGVTEAESYYQWVIETNPGNAAALRALFPEPAGLNIVLTDNLSLYRQRKVRILNGAHTGCVAVACLLGVRSVYEATQHPPLRSFMERLVYGEICPTIAMPGDEVKAYADAILERFANPFVDHEWQTIALNSIGKWRSRLLPVVQDWMRDDGQVPPALATSLAALLLLYSDDHTGRQFAIKDDVDSLDFIRKCWRDHTDCKSLVSAVLANPGILGEDLSGNHVLVGAVSDALAAMRRMGPGVYLSKILGES